MNTFSRAMLGLALSVAIIGTAVAPAYALGGCGPNGHRNGWGRCVWGGQNQNWCLRRTGHTAVPGPNGTWVCLR
jgi:hypothetical protein